MDSKPKVQKGERQLMALGGLTHVSSGKRRETGPSDQEKGTSSSAFWLQGFFQGKELGQRGSGEGVGGKSEETVAKKLNLYRTLRGA